MKIILLMLVLLFVNYIGYGQCLNSVTHESGTEVVNNVAVSVSSSGLVAYGSNCTQATPYAIGTDYNSNFADGGYTFNFAPSINGLTLNFYAINNVNSSNNEEMELFINGNHYSVTSVGNVLYCFNEGSSQTTLPIITPEGYIGDAPGDSKGSACKNLTINGVIESLTVMSHMVGNAYGATFSLRICNDALDTSEFNVIGYRLFPNPFNNQATLHIAQSLSNGKVTLYNLLGQSVKEINNIYGDSIVINRNELLDGMYIFQITENEKILIKGKLSIQ